MATDRRRPPGGKPRQKAAADVSPSIEGDQLRPMSGRGTRPRHKRIDVWCTPEEVESIGYLADVASMSKSTYLREAGLQKTMRTVYDLEAIKDLSKVNGDMGRVAGLLKLWLATPDKRGVGVPKTDVVQMMDDFRSLQSLALDLMAKGIRT